MNEIILYPTETVYGLGVNALDEKALGDLYKLKGRQENKVVSWLVRGVSDIEEYAEFSSAAKEIAYKFLPGPLTLALPIKKEVSEQYKFLPDSIGFRISSDEVAQKLIFEYMERNGAPLTCTSANVSNELPKTSVAEILEQFGEKKNCITKIIDDGIRNENPSTVVSVIDNRVTLIREGVISIEKIKSAGE